VQKKMAVLALDLKNIGPESAKWQNYSKSVAKKMSAIFDVGVEQFI